ncbi:MAG: hypothetical protein H0U99_04340 [Chthoniobacterales bacterium]|nr:hypothetical protein [Chthoniobacterales bacterium]
MSKAYFFTDSKRAARLQREAESWIGTPFREFSKAKGAAGGVDCVGLCEEILRVAGAVDRFTFPRTSADYQGHAFGDRLLQWMRGEIDDPQSKVLKKRFVEFGPKDHTYMPGDLLVLRHFELFHLPIIIDERRHFVNALPRLGVVRGTIQDSSYNAHLVAIFRAKAK